MWQQCLGLWPEWHVTLLHGEQTSPLGDLDGQTLLLVSTWACSAFLWHCLLQQKHPLLFLEEVHSSFQLRFRWSTLMFSPQNHSGSESENFPSATLLETVTSAVGPKADLNWPLRKLGTPCTRRTLPRSSSCSPFASPFALETISGRDCQVHLPRYDLEPGLGRSLSKPNSTSARPPFNARDALGFDPLS